MKYIFVPIGIAIIAYMAAPVFGAFLIYAAVCSAFYGVYRLLKFLFWPSSDE